MRKKDLDSLAQLTATCYANSAERFLFGAEFEALAAARTLLTTLLDGQFGRFLPEASFALEIDGQIMGATLVTHRPTHNLLADVEVHPTLQGQGHARRLIRATLQALSGDPTTPLGLSVTQENLPAYRLYRNLGFVVHQGPSAFWANTSALGVPAPRPPIPRSGP